MLLSRFLRRVSFPLRSLPRFLSSSSSPPSNARFSPSHEWIAAEDGIGTIGISDFAQDQLGDLVYVELPQVGAKLAKGESFGCVESVKSSSDVYTPVSGEVIEANSALNDDPSLINQSPYGDGWMIKVKLDDQAEMDSLLDQDAYQKEISS